MNSEGLHLGGFLRTMQGEIMGLVAFLILLLVTVLIIRRLISKSGSSETEMAQSRSLTYHIAGILLLIALALFVWRAVVVMSVNRMPRSDVDKSGVYEQMDSHTQTPEH